MKRKAAWASAKLRDCVLVRPVWTTLPGLSNISNADGSAKFGRLQGWGGTVALLPVN
jgi:hypothetical protein